MSRRKEPGHANRRKIDCSYLFGCCGLYRFPNGYAAVSRQNRFWQFCACKYRFGLLCRLERYGQARGRGHNSSDQQWADWRFRADGLGVGVQATNEMVRLAMRHRYDNAFEALTAVFQIAAEYAWIISTVPIGICLLICAVVSGLLTEFAGNRWR